jgi:hypothetical protein
MTFKNTLFFYSLQFLNFMYDTFFSLKVGSEKFNKYISNYFNGAHNMWAFLPGYNLPLCFNHIENTILTSWIYNSSTNKLLNTPISVDHTVEKYTIPWLSTSLEITHNQKKKRYELDEFLSTLEIHSIPSHYPTLNLLIKCWSAYSGVWFSPTDTISLIIIDDLGNDIVLTNKQHNRSLSLSMGKLTITHDDSE